MQKAKPNKHSVGKKNKTEVLILLDFKTYYKSRLI